METSAVAAAPVVEFAHEQEFGMTHSRRAQILMEPSDYAQLKVIARRRKVSVAEFIRSAVRAQYLQGAPDRAEAVERIGAMMLPCASWEEMKREIEDSYNVPVP